MLDKNMPDWTKSYGKSKTISVLLFDRFSNHCLANSIEPLRAANTISGRTLYRWRFVSLDGGEITSSSGLPVSTERIGDSRKTVDYLFAMTSYGYRELCGPALLGAIRHAASASQTIVGLDTGAWIFAAAGLLEGKDATIHAAVLEDFSEQFLSVTAKPDRFVIDADCITCGGAMAAFDLALHLIGAHHGQALRLDVEQFFLYQDHSPDPIKRQDNAQSSLVRRALALMDDNLEVPLSMTMLAGRLSCSGKELQRQFSSSLGASPSQVYRHKKLSHAKTLLLSTDLSVAEITVRCGYENTSAMTRAFKAAFATTPLKLRNRRR